MFLGCPADIFQRDGIVRLYPFPVEDWVCLLAVHDELPDVRENRGKLRVRSIRLNGSVNPFPSEMLQKLSELVELERAFPAGKVTPPPSKNILRLSSIISKSSSIVYSV